MIVVTGSSRGLGLAICERLNSLGVDVFGVSRDISNANFPSISCDVSSYEEVKKVALVIKKEGKKVSGLINAAGIASMNLAVTTPPNISQKILEVNLLGTIFCCQLIAPLMMRNKYGSIINFSTIAVSLGLKGESVYAASKAGVEGPVLRFCRSCPPVKPAFRAASSGKIFSILSRGAN